MNPVCVKCGVEMRCFKTGQVCVHITDGHPTSAISCEEWECPLCGAHVLAGFASSAFVEGFEVEEMKNVLSLPHIKCFHGNKLTME